MTFRTESGRTVSGDLTQYLAALDKAWDTPAVQAVVGRLGPYEITEAQADAAPVRRVAFADSGARMEWRRDRLTSVTFTVHDGRSSLPGGGTVEPVLRTKRATFPWIDDLIQGVTRHSTRAEMRSLLGEPLRSWYAYDQFLLEGGRVLSGTFYGSDFKEVTLLAEDPIVLNHGIPWAPIGKRRDGKLYLDVPVSLGIADTNYEFQVSEQQLAALADRARFARLLDQLDGVNDRGKIRKIIRETCAS